MLEPRPSAAGLARRFTPGQWQAVETGLAAVTGRMLALLPAERAAALAEGPVTIDLDTTDVEVYGRKKRGVAYNHQGQRAWPPHVASWAETEITLAADLGDGTDDPRATAPDLLRRALHPDQRALPIPELAEASAIYAYSFIPTNLDVSTPDKAVAAEHWYRHRTSIENLFRDSKHGAALRHLPSGYAQVNTAWMWGALLAASMAAWLHQLTATTRGPAILQGHRVRGGKAMIATLRRRIIAVPGRLIRHARHLTLRLPRGHGLLAEILARLRALPALP